MNNSKVDTTGIHGPTDQNLVREPAPYTPRHTYDGPIDERCTPIPEDEDYRPRRHPKEPEPEPESEPSFRQDPIPSDLLEMGAHYNDHGFPIIPPSEGEPIIPEEVDDFYP